MAVLAGVPIAVALLLGLVVQPAAASPRPLPPPARNTHLAHVYAHSKTISLADVYPTKTLDYMYSSGYGGSVPIPMRTFKKMGHWSRIYNVMPNPPPWVDTTSPVWAPDVRKIGNNYIMWFNAVSRYEPSGDIQIKPRCLGWAESTSPFGPFVSSATQPALCQWSQYGDIDPRTFMDGQQEYLLWKSDDNAGEQPPIHKYAPTKFWSVKLAADGTTIESAPVELLQNTKPWEGALIESPNMVKHDGVYYLFFSGNASNVAESGVGLAFCDTPSGPCHDTYNGPWLGSSLNGSGPDEVSMFQQNGALWLLYSPQATFFLYSVPSLAVTRVAFDGPTAYAAAFDGVEPNP